jgi:hypothetical protein
VRYLSLSLILVLLAQIMGAYFVSTVIMLRLSVPPAFRHLLTRVLAGLEFDFYARWFDAIFAASCLSSGLLLAALHRFALATKAGRRASGGGDGGGSELERLLRASGAHAGG